MTRSEQRKLIVLVLVMVVFAAMAVAAANNPAFAHWLTSQP